MRNQILETLITTLEPIDFVLAFWQGGSAAHGFTDEWSDLDIGVIVEDGYVEETFLMVEKVFQHFLEFAASSEYLNQHGMVILNASIS
jgi:predicted nucleotidyltransferase